MAVGGCLWVAGVAGRFNAKTIEGGKNVESFKHRT